MQKFLHCWIVKKLLWFPSHPKNYTFLKKKKSNRTSELEACALSGDYIEIVASDETCSTLGALLRWETAHVGSCWAASIYRRLPHQNWGAFMGISTNVLCTAYSNHPRMITMWSPSMGTALKTEFRKVSDLNISVPPTLQYCSQASRFAKLLLFPSHPLYWKLSQFWVCEL